MNRPVGVTILAILVLIGAAFCVLGGIGMMLGGGMMATILSQQQAQGSAAGAGVLAGLGAVGGIVMLVIAVLYLLVGIGLWKLKNWARLVTVVLTAIGVVFQLFSLVTLLLHFNIFSVMVTVVVLAIQAVIIWYLLRADVKAAFMGGQASRAAA
jgi:hypothetical protein